MNMPFISSHLVKRENVYFICGFATHELYAFFASLDEMNDILMTKS